MDKVISQREMLDRRFDHRTQLCAFHRTTPAITHYHELQKILSRLLVNRKHESIKHAYLNSTESRTDLVRPLVKELKDMGYKVTLSGMQVDLLCAWQHRQEIRQLRKMVAVVPTKPLEERLIERLYHPHTSHVSFKQCVLGADTNTKITIKRGEPGVKVTTKVHGYGRLRYEEHFCTITFPKGWSYIARQGKHILDKHDNQRYQLVVSYESAQPDLLQFDWQKNWELARVQILKRGKGAAKTLSDPMYMGRCGSITIFDRYDAKVCERLPKLVVKAVKKQFERV